MRKLTSMAPAVRYLLITVEFLLLTDWVFQSECMKTHLLSSVMTGTGKTSVDPEAGEEGSPISTTGNVFFLCNTNIKCVRQINLIMRIISLLSEDD